MMADRRRPAEWTHVVDFGPMPGPQRSGPVDVTVTPDPMARTFEVTVRVRLSEEVMEDYRMAREIIHHYLDEQFARAIGERHERTLRYTVWGRDEEMIAASQQAEAKAEALLIEHMSPSQKAQWQSEHRFTVTSQSGRTFVIAPLYSNNITELDPAGRPVAEHCVVSTERVPLCDQLLAQKLMLESDERRFWRLARTTPRTENGGIYGRAVRLVSSIEEFIAQGP